MKKMLLAVTITTSLLFVSCNGGGGDPKAVLAAFFDALSKKDIDGAKKLATKDSESMFNMIQMGMSMAKDSKDMDKYDKSKLEFGDAKIEGDKATVPVKDKNSGETINYILKKEGGSWKVAFDKASLMQMGADKMKEHGINSADVADSVKSGLDKLKNMNTDSLADKMKEATDKFKELQEKNPEAIKKMEDAMKKMQDAGKQQ
jgi:hypothetical protein